MGDLLLRRRAMMGKPYTAQVEYLESDFNQFINTGIFISSNSRVVMEMQRTFKSFVFYFCSRNSNSSGAGFSFGHNTTNYISDYGGDRKAFSMPSSTSVAKTKVDKNKNVCSIEIPSEGVSETVTNTPNDFSTSYPFVIMGQNSAGSLTGAPIRIFNCTIEEDGVKVRDFIPVRVGTVGYLYDRVSGKLFGNEGTGDFVVGPDIQ